jgi:hypothetical protein
MAGIPHLDVIRPRDESVRSKVIASVMNAVIATTGLRPWPPTGAGLQVDLIIGLETLLSQQNAAQKENPPKKTKAPRQPPPKTAVRYWTVSEVQNVKGWSNAEIHRMFDRDPDCLRKGNPDPHRNAKGKLVRGYVTILGIPDSSIAREEARMLAVMKNPGKGIRLA